MNSEFLNRIPDDWWHESGSVFYSGSNAWQGYRPLYILGLNPGGNLRDREYPSIKKHTEKNTSANRANWSEYKNEVWDDRKSGAAPHQKRMVHLLEKLGLEPRDVPASNVVFRRTRNSREMDPYFTEWVEKCWPFVSTPRSAYC